MTLPFQHAHATHPDWRIALSLAAAQLDAQRDAPLDRHRRGGGGRAADAPTLGFVYVTDHYAGDADALLDALRRRWPGVAWVGAVGVGVAAGGVEYIDEPALVLMLAALPRESFRVFSGAQPLGRFDAHTALVHADGTTPDLAELIAELAARTGSGYLFGGLASSRGAVVHFADGAWRGGLSGVAFTRDVALVSRVTQGCQPVAPARRVTAAERHVVRTLDGEPALDCLLRDLGVDPRHPRSALARIRTTLVGLSDGDVPGLARAGPFGVDTRVRHLVGIDPAERAIAVADVVEPGMQLAFCQRDADAARRDLVRICAEIREELGADATQPVAAAGVPAAAAPFDAASRIRGAIYVSCAGRGGPHFGGPSAELQIVRRALGDVPLAGFFAGGEIGHRHLYGYTGVLTVFVGR
ncbi:FIST signal transduction protein [Azohydromonas sediminis]|uniref:FIST signal transduction protein n=1 Tax=Azohydromonas sediminis TaxID=2259674 RepID=UPI000E659EAB|nr:FIST N-terminal domain-containing protein [Azohydromonas sediminis]